MAFAGAMEASPETEAESTLESWQHAGKWFAYGGHAIFSRIEGEGDAVLLLHGFPTSSWDWHRLWPFLTAQYHALALDMIGFGFSDKPPAYDYSIVDQADLYAGWLEQLGVTRVHLLAHDYGCSVAQELLAREQEGALPCTVASTCFLNGGLFPEVHQPFLIQRLMAGPLGGLVSRAVTRGVFEHNMMRLFGPRTRPTTEQLDDYWQLLLYNNGRGLLHCLISFLEERRVHRHRWVGALQHTASPLLFLCGTHDPVSGRLMANRFEELVPEGRVERLEGIGHFPQIEAPQRAWQAYRQFLAQVD